MAAALPADVAFSHVTAARLLDLPTPRAWQAGEPVQVMRATGTPLVVRDGCVGHRGLESRGVLVHRGVRVVDPLNTLADLVGWALADLVGWALDDLVAVADVVAARFPDAWVEHMPRVISRRRGGRGVARLRQAVALARPASASAWESKARVAFGLWGLPEPELNVDVRDGDGRWLARPDFVWRAAHVVAEYDGDQHRTDRRAWQYERERRAGLEDAGWAYVELTALTLTQPDLRERLRRRLQAYLTARCA